MTNERDISLIDQIFFFESAIADKTKVYDNHYHSWFEIYYLENGKCNYLIEDTLYEVKTGDIVLIPAYQIHKTAYSTTSHSRLLVCLSDNYLPPYISALLSDENFIYRNPKITANAYAILKNIEGEYLHWDDYSSDMINSYVHMFFTLLSRNQNYYKNERSGGNIHVERILNYIKENYPSDITLAQTARDYSISPEHLSRIFKKETGLSFHEYLTSIRLKQAEYLLKQSDKNSISQIAYSCGFNDSNYFSYKFKSVYGISPLQFQKQYMENLDNA